MIDVMQNLALFLFLPVFILLGAGFWVLFGVILVQEIRARINTEFDPYYNQE